MREDMNRGYQGWSMSRRAAAAYGRGEMPRSKWTKAAMGAAVDAALADEGIELDGEQRANLAKMPKKAMFELLFEPVAWHHTSKMCNVTDFYAVDAGALRRAAGTSMRVEWLLTVDAPECGRRVERRFASERERARYIERNSLAPCRPAGKGARVWWYGNGRKSVTVREALV